MSAIRGIVAAAFLLTSAISANASEYQHFKGMKNWRAGVIEFLHRFKPAPEAVTSGINGEFDVHVYLVPGNFNGTYTVLRMKHQTEKASNTLKSLIDGGTAKIFGFAGEDVYVLTWTKPTS